MSSRANYTSGNIISKAVGIAKVDFKYDLANQLVRRSDNTEFIRYAYDKAGRLTHEINQDNQSLATYSYGYLDKVMSVQRQDTAPVAFSYDATGMLVGKQKAGQTTTYQWDGIALAAKGNTLFANEDHVCGGAVLAENKLEDSAQPEYFLSDYLGTTLTSLEDKADANKFGLTRLAFGQEAGTDASERFTGKPYDEDLQAYVFPFRNYRADLCRWTSTDPSGFPDAENAMAYAPVPNVSMDPMGLYIHYRGDSDGGIIVVGEDYFGAAADLLAWNAIETFSAFSDPLAVTAMEHADGTLAGNWNLSSSEIDTIKSSDDYKKIYKSVQYTLNNSLTGINDPSIFQTTQHFLFTHGTDEYYAFGHADISTDGTVTDTTDPTQPFANPWTYDATVTLSDTYTFSQYSAVSHLTPTGLGYRLQSHGRISPFTTSATWKEQWEE